MASTLQIGTDSLCPTCKIIPPVSECTCCFICKETFHAVCINHDDGIIGSKTMVKTFVSTSTKENFKFFCNECLTNFERNLIQTENAKLSSLVNQVTTMETKLTEISLKLDEKQRKQTSKQEKQSIWSDEERLATVKAPPLKSILVIKKPASNVVNEEKLNHIQGTVIDNNIPVTKSYTNKAGDTIMVCASQEDRDKLKTLIDDHANEIETRTPTEKRSQISIVGLKKEFKKDEIIKMLVLQNSFLKRFANSNDINHHVKINSVKPLKNNNACFQAFAQVSKTIREGMNFFGNKLTLGLSTCRIYDRLHVKRCFICQHFGHYKNECPTPTEHACSKCGDRHSTKDCTNQNAKCINCTRDGAESIDHFAFSYKCPSLINQQKESKKRLNYQNSRPHQDP